VLSGDKLNAAAHRVSLGLDARTGNAPAGAESEAQHGRYPARAFIAVDKLLRGAHFEVMGVAVRTTAH